MSELFATQTTSQLLEAVKRRAFLPNTQTTLSDEDILRFLNEELKDSILPLILQFHEEYLVYTQDFTLIANKDIYKVPYRAIGRKLRDIKYKDPQNNLYMMTRILPEDRSYFQEVGYNPYKTFFMRGDDIVLVPGVGSLPTGSLAMAFYMCPNKIVKEERTATITNVDVVQGILTVDSIPENITVGSLIDFIEAKPGNKLYYYDVPVLAIDVVNKTITVDPSLILTNFSDNSLTPLLQTELEVGDFINTAGEACLAQIPFELNSLLAERGAARCLASLGHLDNLQAANVKIAELEQKSGALIDNRAEGTPMKVNNLGGLLRISKISKRRFYF